MARKRDLFEELEYRALSRRGEGVADRATGARVRTFGAVPGERARTMLGSRRKGAHLGWIQEVAQPVPGRVEPRCPHFARCGGCTHQHLDYPTQVRLKTQSLLARLGPYLETAELLPTVPAPSPFYYRSKVEFSFMGAPARLGFNRRGCWDRLVEVRECFIGPPQNREVLAVALGWARSRQLPGWNPRSLTGCLRYLVLRHSRSTGQWLAALVTSAAAPGVEELARQLMQLGATGVVHAEQSSPGAAVKPDSERLVLGEAVIEERLEELRFELSWRSFFQSNPAAYLEMLREARRWTARPGQTILDLFCGVGTVGLFLLGSGSRLVGVEAVPDAAEDARRNAGRNQRSAVFHCCPSEDWEDLGCDLLVLDPPRSGCHPRLVQRVAERGPEEVLYISCNAERLAEELEALAGSYRVERLRLFDFFPNTRHMEALVGLRRLT
ncbi:MAG: 23S rRNA (uracil(1939)-C(5))-methyltransferase RlmD [Armatimonadetes bacterium]|nr:23S rRNA (uracil(1939)-C(5))-methyltransferase RlmD [Armatimonadota bacterium]